MSGTYRGSCGRSRTSCRSTARTRSGLVGSCRRRRRPEPETTSLHEVPPSLHSSHQPAPHGDRLNVKTATSHSWVHPWFGIGCVEVRLMRFSAANRERLYFYTSAHTEYWPEVYVLFYCRSFFLSFFLSFFYFAKGSPRWLYRQGTL